MRQWQVCAEAARRRALLRGTLGLCPLRAALGCGMPRATRAGNLAQALIEHGAARATRPDISTRDSITNKHACTPWTLPQQAREPTRNVDCCRCFDTRRGCGILPSANTRISQMCTLHTATNVIQCHCRQCDPPGLDLTCRICSPALGQIRGDELVLHVFERERTAAAVVAIRRRLGLDVGPHADVCAEGHTGVTTVVLPMPSTAVTAVRHNRASSST